MKVYHILLTYLFSQLEMMFYYKTINRLLVFSLLAVMWQSCHNNAGVKVVYKTQIIDSVLDYTKQELSGFLNEEIIESAGEEGIHNIEFIFSVSPKLPEAAFGIDSRLDDGKLRVELSGQTPSDVLNAAYTFLEKGGYLFDITGPVYPAKFNWKALSHYNETIVPAIKKRGIRQHINFPMDLSAWSLKEAKSYIHNLSRMRFNYITFHSYPGQWYEIDREDTTEYAGHFFYGDVHLVPDYKPIRDIAVNKKYFCIPEIEPFFKDREKRSKMAIEWLRNLVEEAKRTGMKVQFSFEPRNISIDLKKSIETVKSVIKEYPGIDALEFITEEAGGWGPRTTEENTKNIIKEHFGKEFLDDETVMAPVKGEQSDLAYIYGQVGHNIELIKYLRENKIIPENISLKLGIYVVIPSYAKPAFYLARKFLPETEISLMPGHHSLRVKNNAKVSLVSSEDWGHSIIYSWIEFDGMMFLQQNGISGIKGIVEQAVNNSPGHRGNTILYNHWRTAENRITARYAAISGLYGAVEPSEFYREYAGNLGLEHVDAFVKTMNDLDSTDLLSLKRVGGIGFCWVGRWRNGRTISAYAPENIVAVRDAYKKVLNDLKVCSSNEDTKAGRELLRIIGNRLRTSVIYLKAFEKGYELNTFNKKVTLEENEKTEYARICNEGLTLLNQYIDIYSSENSDRGCAGNLISLWYGPVRAFKYMREKKGGVSFDDKVPDGIAVDAPPLPVINPDK